ncbi:MAG: hypothetical protein K0V04_45030 [Deltaproteobacteria bacterium]|nr:hypothetical protein [Deltaproteobacteria bacterium]
MSTNYGQFLELARRERTFLLLLAAGFFLAGVTFRHPVAGAWVGFLFASYSAVANDSIQTLGTFIASNRNKPWWILWLFIGGVFLVTVTYSWIQYDGDVSYQRLAAKGFETAPTSFTYLQIAAPLFLLILTRLKMPVSTTFLLLTGFATSASSIGKVLSKSLSGYVLALFLAIAVWTLLSKPLHRMLKGKAHPAWRIVQWCTTAFLWSVWLMQDAANIAVYLPRSLGGFEFLCFAGAIFLGLGLLFRMRGDRIQEVVEEKSEVVDVRAATLIDMVFAGILLYFKMHSKMPMSTTWVFIGLLSGRELAMTWMRANKRTMKQTMRMITKDLASVTIGLIVSIALALAVNDAFRRELLSTLGLG